MCNIIFYKQHILVCTTCHYYPLFLFSNTPSFFLHTFYCFAYYSGTGNRFQRQEAMNFHFISPLVSLLTSEYLTFSKLCSPYSVKQR